MASYESDDWISTGNTFVRKVLLYSAFNLPFEGKRVVSCCSYGGPIAVGIADSSKNLWAVNIFKSDGNCIADINTHEITFMSWTKDQKLIVMNPEGYVILYNALGETLDKFDMGEVFLVEQAMTFLHDNDTGLIVLNKSNEFSGISSIKSRALWRVVGKDDAWEKKKISCWTTVSKSTEPTCIIVCSRTSLFRGILSEKFASHDCEWTVKTGSYISMTPNNDCSLIAFMHNSGRVQIVTVSLDSVVNVLQLSVSAPLKWCGNDLVCIQKSPRQLEFAVIKSNDKIDVKFPYDVHVGIDNDSIRAFSRNSCYIVSAVPQSMVEALNCLSRGPTALLYDASKKLYDSTTSTADAYVYVKMIGDQMTEAVTQCINAAANHLNPETQKKLLRAAHMGMSFCENYDRSTFIDVQKKLRVLNTLRRYGFPLTYWQLRELGVSGVVSRLTSLHEWTLSIELCKFMEVRDDKSVYVVLNQWYRWAISAFNLQKEKLGEPITSKAERELAQKLLQCLRSHPKVNYSDIADFAVRKGLNTLAYVMLDHEIDLSRQINVLFKLKDYKKALTMAVQSEQPNLLHMVLDHMRRRVHDTSNFEALLNKYPQAMVLYQNQMHDSAPDKVLELYRQNGDVIRQAIYYLKSAEELSTDFDISKVQERLHSASDALSRDTALAQLIDQSIQLIKDNGKLEERYACVMTDKSVRKSFIIAVSKGDVALSELMRKQHKLSDKQYWLWMVAGYAKGNHWPQLEQFGRTKRSPVGYLPLIEACCRNGNVNLAQRFSDKIVSYEEQIRAKTLMNDVLGAARLAASRKDLVMLQTLRRQQQPKSITWDEITCLIESLE